MKRRQTERHWADSPRLRLGRRLLLLAALGFGASCQEQDAEITGRLFVAPINALDGTAVGLAVDFIRTSGATEGVEDIELEVLSDGVEFLGSRPGPLCLRFPRSGRLSMLARGGTLDARARVILRARRPLEAADEIPEGTAGSPTAGAAGALIAASSGEHLTCRGKILDDAVWPTRGAQTVPLPASGGASSGGAPTTGGDSPGGSSSTGGSNTAGESAGGAAGGG